MAKQNIPTPCKQFSLERFSKAGDFFLTKAVCEIAESEMEKNYRMWALCTWCPVTACLSNLAKQSADTNDSIPFVDYGFHPELSL